MSFWSFQTFKRLWLYTCGNRVSWKSCWNVGLFRKSWKLNVCCELPNCCCCWGSCCCGCEGKLENCCCCCCGWPLCCCSLNWPRGFRNCEGLKNVLMPLMKGWKNVPKMRKLNESQEWEYQKMILCLYIDLCLFMWISLMSNYLFYWTMGVHIMRARG